MKRLLAIAFLGIALFACSEEKSIKEYTVEEISKDKALAKRLETELTSKEYNDYIEGAMNYVYDTEKAKKKKVKELIDEGSK